LYLLIIPGFLAVGRLHGKTTHRGRKRGIVSGRHSSIFILIELIAYNSYNTLDFDTNFWRTKSGLEVDFVLQEVRWLLKPVIITVS